MSLLPDPLPGVDPNNDDSITGADILDVIDKFLVQYVIYPNEHMRHAHVLWIVHTHFMDLWDSTPRIHFKSPEPGSGKTRALEVSEHIVHRGFIALNMTPASLIRKLGDKPENRPTLLVDEVDTIFGPKAREHEDIRGIINAGHRRSGKSSRCIQQGNQWVVEDFPAYGAVGLAGMGDLPETIRSRAIVVSMKKRNKATEEAKSWRAREDEPKAKLLGALLARWATAVKQERWDGKQYVFDWPAMPPGVEDRVADCWEALFVCASFAGGRWPLICDVAAVAAVADARETEEGPSRGVQLLTDIRQIFTSEHIAVGGVFVSLPTYLADNKNALKTPVLLENLARLEESPWSQYNRDGSRLAPRGLARLLKPYGISSDNIRWADGTNSKGYYRKSFEDAWERYVENANRVNNHPVGDESFLKNTAEAN